MIEFDPIGWLNHDRPWPNVSGPAPGFTIREQPIPTLLAMCCWGEARADGPLGMLLIGCVVRNRVRQDPRYGRGWIGVLTKPGAFRCFIPDDPHFEQVRFPLQFGSYHCWQQACEAAADILSGRAPDLTDGATHYADETHPQDPAMILTIIYRRRRFFRVSV